MPVRILCLHGMGVNSDVFRVQTAPFRALLPNSFDFQFFDGDLTCNPSPGAADFYAGPYHCWYDTPTTDSVIRAHSQVSTIIRDHGPFEVVMGFSQGAALAASMILHHQMEHPTEPPLFRAAIFICSPLPFACSINHGIDVRKCFGVEVSERLNNNRPTTVPASLVPDPYFLQREKAMDAVVRPDSDSDFDSTSGYSSSDNGSGLSTPATSTSVDSSRTSFPFPKSFKLQSQASLATGFAPSASTDFSSKPIFYNMFHATTDSARIAIPTAHIYGHRDAWRQHGLDLMKLCAGNVIAFEHDGGHEVPKEASEYICDAVEEVVACAGLTG